MQILSLFLSKGTPFILFVLSYFLLKVGDQTGAVQIAAFLFCMATLYTVIMRFISAPKEVYRIWLLKQIIYLGFFGLASYYDSLVFVAFAFIVYNGLITLLAFIQKLRGIYFINEALPQAVNNLFDLLQKQNNNMSDHQQQALKTVNDIYIRNVLIMFLVYIIILPFSRTEGFQGLYVFIAFIVFPLVNWRLNLNMISKMFNTFVNTGAQSWEEALVNQFNKNPDLMKGVTITKFDVDVENPNDGNTTTIKLDEVILKRLEDARTKLAKTYDSVKAKRDHYKQELDKAQASNNEQAIALAKELYNQSQDTFSQLQKRIDDLDIKIAKVKDGDSLSEKELEDLIETGLKTFLSDMFKNNPRFKEMFGDDINHVFDDKDDDKEQSDDKTKETDTKTSAEPTAHTEVKPEGQTEDAENKDNEKTDKN